LDGIDRRKPVTRHLRSLSLGEPMKRAALLLPPGIGVLAHDVNAFLLLSLGFGHAALLI
jgi:hypothetical protein